MSGTNFKRERVDFGNPLSYLIALAGQVQNYNDDGGTPNTFYTDARPFHRAAAPYNAEPSLVDIGLDGYNRGIFACAMEQDPSETQVTLQVGRDPAAADQFWFDASPTFQPSRSTGTGTVLGDVSFQVKDPALPFAALTDQAFGSGIGDLLYARVKIDASGGGGAKNFYWCAMLTQSMNAAQSNPPRGQAFGG